jgi:predicted helicase
MFAARLHDTDLNTFSRQEAMDDLPASNPFLKGLFQYIAGPSLPRRLEYIVDDLVQVMRASDPHSLFKDFGKFTARNDPFIHFYEDFLSAYNPAKRKSRGVWYTPEPVVDFIVRAVDHVLKNEFGLADGLADTSKVTVDWDTGRDHPKTRKPITEKRELHRVQILDPAAGTGTFLAKVVQTVADCVKARAPGKWSAYVEQDLLPRLHGFELLMASYAMCHMKLDMMLDQTGYKPSKHPPRLSVWLTNSLEPPEREVKDLFFQPLAEEARGASEVKRQTPIMCVIGNPPYSGESANKGDHIMALMEAYKKEPGGKDRLKERNPKWINDDYVKFIRMAEDLIARNPSGGVLGFITNHGYLDNPTFRGMRWHLRKTFDSIYVYDLHGSSIRQEMPPHGVADKNVFDIMPGVAIILAVKKSASSALASLNHGDLWGSRSAKSEALWSGTVESLAPVTLAPRAPQHVFVPRDHSIEETYFAWFRLNDLMPSNSNGIVTSRDALTIAPTKRALWERVQEFAAGEPEAMRSRFHLGRDAQDWSIDAAQRDLRDNLDQAKVVGIAYRPFETFWTFFTGQSRGFLCRPRAHVMRNYLEGENLGILVTKAHKDATFAHAFVTATISEAIFLSGTTASNAMNLPLYLYPETVDQAGQTELEARISADRRPNFDPTLYAAVCKAAGIDPAHLAKPDDDFRAATSDMRPSEVKVFDYIYGVLYAPVYRQKFAEFLKIDFPRIPLPPSPGVFREVSEKGERLRRLHLMELAAIGETPYPYKGEGDDVVVGGYPKFEGGSVHINKTQYFEDVSKLAWEFHIGGYQPAQKWLKDRRGRTLSFDDVTHYQKIVKILVETDQIMKEIELPLG